MSDDNSGQVTIVDIKMPFSSMVIFMVKWVLASIPAFFILTIIGAVIFSILGTIFGPGMH